MCVCVYMCEWQNLPLTGTLAIRRMRRTVIVIIVGQGSRCRRRRRCCRCRGAALVMTLVMTGGGVRRDATTARARAAAAGATCTRRANHVRVAVALKPRHILWKLSAMLAMCFHLQAHEAVSLNTIANN